MYSDFWLKQGYVKKITRINEHIVLSEWIDDSRQIVGVSFSFNYENDIHFELKIDEWKKFLKDVLETEDEINYIKNLKVLFEDESPYRKLAEILDTNSIKYQKIAFY